MWFSIQTKVGKQKMCQISVLATIAKKKSILKITPYYQSDKCGSGKCKEYTLWTEKVMQKLYWLENEKGVV